MDKKILVFVFIIFHLSAVIAWNLDNKFDVPDKIINFYKPYMYSLSLWQAWDIFSPNVATREASTRILIEKGNKTDNYLQYYSQDGMPFLFTRFRKFNDNIIFHNDDSLNSAYLTYLCKKFYNIYEPGFEIRLEAMHEDIILQKKDQESKVSYEKLGDITCS